MNSAVQIRPTDAYSVFTPDDSVEGDDARFHAGPVVFLVPERASGQPPNLYIVVDGWISFASPYAADPGRRGTTCFGTQVGYFRLKNDKLSHIYGAHYDMEEVLAGHPIFHAQIRSMDRLRSVIAQEFRIAASEEEDLAQGLLSNVRTPTAQMDVFAVITQIGADHLMTGESGPQVLDAFARLRGACDFFLGAGGRLAYLNSPPAIHCYRSTHWYERT